MLRVESGLFFANADAVRDAVAAAPREPGVRAVVLDAEAIAFVDVTAVRMLSDLAESLERDHVELALAHGIGQVRDIMRTGEARVKLFPTVEATVEALRA